MSQPPVLPGFPLEPHPLQAKRCCHRTTCGRISEVRRYRPHDRSCMNFQLQSVRSGVSEAQTDPKLHRMDRLLSLWQRAFHSHKSGCQSSRPKPMQDVPIRLLSESWASCTKRGYVRDCRQLQKHRNHGRCNRCAATPCPNWNDHRSRRGRLETQSRLLVRGISNRRRECRVAHKCCRVPSKRAADCFHIADTIPWLLPAESLRRTENWVQGSLRRHSQP